MLYRFKSRATADTLMLDTVAEPLLTIMGKEITPQGVITVAQIPDAIAALKQAVIDKLTHENAILKRLKFAAKSERFSAEQKSLLDETLDEDLQAVADEIEQAMPAVAADAALVAHRLK